MQEHRFAYLKNNPFLTSHTPALHSVIKTRIFVRFGRKRVNRIEALEVNTSQVGISAGMSKTVVAEILIILSFPV